MRFRQVAVGLLVLANFVCPLLFFTDFTRNPYLTQIALLNVFLLAAGAVMVSGWAWAGEWRLPRTPVDVPWAAWLGVCTLSWLVSYAGHLEFFHPAMRSEGGKAFQFLLVNAALPFYLAVTVPTDSGEEPKGGLHWAVFTAAWGLSWYLFSINRQPALSNNLFDHIWDPTGALIWAAGIAATLYLARRGTLLDFWHLALSIGCLASAYAVMQYLNMDWIWPKVLNPYGGRSVSTFGNPNFMSSYLVMLAPLSVVLALKARDWAARAFYVLSFWAIVAALLCSLTRSSWIGAVVGLSALAFWSELRGDARRQPLVMAALLGPAVLMVLFWPNSTVEGYTPSVLGRITEMSWIWHKAVPAAGNPAALPTTVLEQGKTVVYAPFHQRLLIWASAWQMALENPITGKGYGVFELFYPFYQGPLLLAVEMFRVLRTHANNAHDEILEVLSQTGLLGLGVFLWLWASIAAVFRHRRRGPGEWVRWAAFAGVAGMLADNMLNVSMHFAVPGFLFWWQAGTVVAPERDESERWRVLRPPAPAAVAVWALCAALAAWGSWGWGKQWLREADYFSGFKRIRQGQVADAVKVLEEAHAADPREVNTDYELGNAYARAQDFPKAQWAYDEALRSNCGYDEIFFNKASLYANHQGQPEEAIKQYRMSFFINPLSKDTISGMVNLYLKDPVKYHDEAVVVLKRAIELFPDDVNYLSNLGYFYVQAKDYEAALPLFRKAVQIDPDFNVSKLNLQHVLGQLHRDKDPMLAALKDWDELQARVGKQDYSPRSLVLAEASAKAFPDSSKVHLYLANLLLLNNRLAEAEPEFRAVLAREPGHVPAHKNLAVLYEKTGRPADAAREYQAVLAAAPSDAEAQAGLARVRNR